MVVSWPSSFDHPAWLRSRKQGDSWRSSVNSQNASTFFEYLEPGSRTCPTATAASPRRSRYAHSRRTNSLSQCITAPDIASEEGSRASILMPSSWVAGWCCHLDRSHICLRIGYPLGAVTVSKCSSSKSQNESNTYWEF